VRRILIILAAVLVLAVAAIVAIVVLATPASVTTSSVVVEEDDDFGTVAVYAVLEDGSLDPAATGLTAEVWETFTRVTTIDFAAEVMTQYRVGDAPDSDTLAYVYQDEDPLYWVLAANLATSEDHEQLVATLIHEYAHILSLGTDELDVETAECAGLALDEGCAGEQSLLLGFQRTFWASYGDASPTLDNVDADVAWEFYLAHEEDFVSDYAATNTVEDFAESFMTFVFEDEPSGGSVVASKLAYFWGFPELVAIRERIRAEFADDLGLAE
jgi:hypothetical protein